MLPNDDLCDVCGYHLILKKVIDISDMKRRSHATGFERALQDQLHDSESAGGALLLLKVVAVFLGVALMFLCLGAWWWIGVLGAGAGIAWYWFKYTRQSEGAAEDSEVNQDPLAALIWSTMLLVQRSAGWWKFEWPPKRSTALTLCDPTFDDEELGGLNGLAEIEALDLEGTGISNNGLEHLRDKRQLRFLVVRRTKVTRSGVVKLQRDLPQLVIWQ
jgi:hypothetical protein